jgi:hypothetical protein
VDRERVEDFLRTSAAVLDDDLAVSRDAMRWTPENTRTRGTTPRTLRDIEDAIHRPGMWPTLPDDVHPSPVTEPVELIGLIRPPGGGLVDDLIDEVRTRPPTPPRHVDTDTLQDWYRRIGSTRRVMFTHPDRVEEIQVALRDADLAGGFEVRPCEYIGTGTVIVGPWLGEDDGFLLTGQ